MNEFNTKLMLAGVWMAVLVTAAAVDEKLFGTVFSVFVGLLGIVTIVTLSDPPGGRLT